MSNITPAISHYSISQRINNPGTTFAVKFNIPTDPENFVTGENISFQLTDTLNPLDFEVYNGKIQKIDKNLVINGKVFDMTGRDKGYYLARQFYRVDCDLVNTTVTPILTHFTNVLKDTGCTLGKGSFEIENINLSNNPKDANFFGGEFKPKYKAIDLLFKVYCELKGLNKVRWFIDSSSKLRWFEISKTRGKKIAITSADEVTVLDTSDDATNIINSIEGFAGSNSEIYSQLQDKESIARHGLLEGEPITDTKITTAEDLHTKLEEELKQKSKPIYTARVTFSGIRDFECGQQVIFPEEELYQNLVFTITEITKEGTIADPKTNISLTTDESSISPTNLFENVKTIVETVVQEPVVAVVQQVDKVTQQAIVKPANSPVRLATNFAGTKKVSGGGSGGAGIRRQ